MSEEIICGIYKITSPSGRIYIGKSKDCLNRKLQYQYNAVKNQIRVFNSIKKYGWLAHTFEIIHECQLCDTDYWEIYYISFYQSYGNPFGMNLTIGGGGTNGSKHSDEAKKKISIGNKGKIVPMETREQIRKTLTGVKHTEERRNNIRNAQIGRKITEEQRRKMSIAMKGKVLPKRTPEQIADKIKNHPSRRAVLDTKTGILYFDCKKAAESIGWNYKTLRGQLLGNNRNKTNFIYA